MKYEEVKIYEGEHVRIVLKSGDIYTGTIKECNQGSFVIFDKFSKLVTIDYEVCGLIKTMETKEA